MVPRQQQGYLEKERLQFKLEGRKLRQTGSGQEGQKGEQEEYKGERKRKKEEKSKEEIDEKENGPRGNQLSSIKEEEGVKRRKEEKEDWGRRKQSRVL